MEVAMMEADKNQEATNVLPKIKDLKNDNKE
jgi:hypothetical protein